jgi:protein-disulfide isomerase
MRVALALIASLALASCGGGSTDGNVATAQGPAAPKVAAPAGKKWVDVVEKTPEGGMRQGNPNAPVKLVEFGSRSCPGCGYFATTAVEPLREKYVSTGQVSYEFRDFPLHPQDLGLILIGHCVPAESFFPILDGMYADQKSFNDRATQIPEATFRQMQSMAPGDQAKQFVNLLGYAEFMKQRGVSQAQLDKCLSDQSAIDAVAKNAQAGVEKGVTGTPSFFINDVKFEGGWEQMEPALRAAGAR